MCESPFSSTLTLSWLLPFVACWRAEPEPGFIVCTHGPPGLYNTIQSNTAQHNMSRLSLAVCASCFDASRDGSRATCLRCVRMPLMCLSTTVFACVRVCCNVLCSGLRALVWVQLLRRKYTTIYISLTHSFQASVQLNSCHLNANTLLILSLIHFEWIDHVLLILWRKKQLAEPTNEDVFTSY